MVLLHGAAQDFVAPGGDMPRVRPIGSFGQNPIDVLEIFLIGAGGVVIREGLLAIGVGRVQAVQFGEHDGLNDSETFLGAGVEVKRCILAAETVEEFPGGVAEPHEGLAVGLRQLVAVARHAELSAGRDRDQEQADQAYR